MLKCLLTTWLDPKLYDSQCCAHLGCQTWSTNHDLKKKVIVLMNASHCYMQTPTWTRGLTNYLMMIGCALQILFQDLIDPFRLPIHLGVEV